MIVKVSYAITKKVRNFVTKSEHDSNYGIPVSLIIVHELPVLNGETLLFFLVVLST